ncbi:hypothetical protein KH5H1_40840 [Corallococcus caeni]|nr:hypothetical protein KH5H1_40840 [Corallococcus sp. KH5-1]
MRRPLFCTALSEDFMARILGGFFQGTQEVSAAAAPLFQGRRPTSPLPYWQ